MDNNVKPSQTVIVSSIFNKILYLSVISVSPGVIFINISIQVLIWMDTLISLLSFLESKALSLMDDYDNRRHFL